MTNLLRAALVGLLVLALKLAQAPLKAKHHAWTHLEQIRYSLNRKFNGFMSLKLLIEYHVATYFIWAILPKSALA